MKTYLCIGGPAAGARVQIPKEVGVDRVTFSSVYLHSKLPVSTFIPERAHETMYRIFYLYPCGSEYPVEVLVPPDIDPITELLQSYEKHHDHRD